MVLPSPVQASHGAASSSSSSSHDLRQLARAGRVFFWDALMSAALQTLWDRVLDVLADTFFSYIWTRPWQANLYAALRAEGLTLPRPFRAPSSASISIADWALELPQELPPKVQVRPPGCEAHAGRVPAQHRARAGAARMLTACW